MIFLGRARFLNMTKTSEKRLITHANKSPCKRQKASASGVWTALRCFVQNFVSWGLKSDIPTCYVVKGSKYTCPYEQELRGGLMRRKSECSLVWELAACLGISLLFSSAANAARGTEIKLPPLRVEVGAKAPDFAIPDANGKIVRLSSFRGRNVLVDFYRGYW